MTIKSRYINKSIKASFQLDTKDSRAKEKRYTAEPQRRIDICLACTKPAKECKGNCFDGK